MQACNKVLRTKKEKHPRRGPDDLLQRTVVVRADEEEMTRGCGWGTRRGKCRRGSYDDSLIRADLELAVQNKIIVSIPFFWMGFFRDKRSL